ncbi:VWA-like domain-containing protein [Apilactobacillus apisilvae]|uniref:VWA-like domain-containing protein n=1 Tax=Apilactobacillus apisilvae TaxID=2923364 RepID=A0ABY4PIM5_9LACO|nr:VWA-like domain-containing protein [Apilactobacillus apisilvae]UQS85344.1 VWA-like domain-containing protein [Apilactobacillus apisilvae]
MNINDLIYKINNSDNDKKINLIQKLISRVIIDSFSQNKIYGYILMNLKRTGDSNLKSSFALEWEENSLIIGFNPQLFSKSIKSEIDIIAILQHLALHIIWLHPVRYNGKDNIENIASDISVNQYIDDVPKNAWTIEKITYFYQTKMPKFKDSSEYIKLLNTFMIKQKSESDSNNMKLMDDHKKFHKSDSGQSPKYKKIKEIIKQSVKNIDNRKRGKLPNPIKKQIEKITSKPVNLNKYLQMGISNIPYSKKDTINRFNRRQAYRMEIPGKMSNTIVPINIFIDHSGSISNDNLQNALSKIINISKHYPSKITIYPFDTKVYLNQSYVLNSTNDIKFIRNANGGTSYQSIFDFIAKYHLKDGLALIFTDGIGEEDVNNYGFDNVLWLLEGSSDNLSVNKHIGKIININKIK